MWKKSKIDVTKWAWTELMLSMHVLCLIIHCLIYVWVGLCMGTVLIKGTDLSNKSFELHHHECSARAKIRRRYNRPIRYTATAHPPTSRVTQLGVDIYIGRTDSAICPVEEFLKYVSVRGYAQGSLLRFSDGSPHGKSVSQKMGFTIGQQYCASQTSKS